MNFMCKLTQNSKLEENSKLRRLIQENNVAVFKEMRRCDLAEVG